MCGNIATVAPFALPRTTSRLCSLRPRVVNQFRIPQFSVVSLYSTTTGEDEDSYQAISRLPRIYVAPTSSALSSNSILPLGADQSNHLNVMRISNTKRWGDLAGHVRVFNGQDGEWLAKLVVNSTPERKRRRRNELGDAAVIECLQALREQEEETSSFGGIFLHMGRTKKVRRKWVLEKATELGVDGIDVVDTEYSALTDAWEYDKHCSHVREAAEQSERLNLPQLSKMPTTWSELMDQMEQSSSPNSSWLICRERSPESQPILRTVSQMTKEVDTSALAVHLLVGPEGGWSPQELDDLDHVCQQKANVQFVSLGSSVLRAETAAIVATSAVVLSSSD